jgi:membrane associated rhomboid family serine protease
MSDTRLARSRGDRVRTAAVLMAGWVALLWVLEVVDVATGHALDGYGVVPRTPSELVDVVPSAFIHFGFSHVAANSVPLLVLGFLAALGGVRRFLAVCALIVVADGLGVWLISPADTNTAGASGLIFGLFGYLLVSGAHWASWPVSWWPRSGAARSWRASRPPSPASAGRAT